MRRHPIGHNPTEEVERRVSSALLAVTANQPELLDSVRVKFSAFMKDLLKRAQYPKAAAVVVLAANGLHLMELLRLAPLDSRQRKAVRKELLRMAEQEEI